MSNFISPATVRKIGALLIDGHSIRSVSKALNVNRGTVCKYALKFQPEKCVCGKEARHRGWCGPRYLKSSVHKELIAKVHADFIESPRPAKPPKVQKPTIRMEYPYCIGGPSTGNALLMAVNAAVSKRLPDEARADICQELLLSILEGDLTIQGIIPAAHEQTKKRQALFSHFATVSLDAQVGSDDEGRPLMLLDTIPHDYEPIISKTLRAAPGMT